VQSVPLVAPPPPPPSAPVIPAAAVAADDGALPTWWARAEALTWWVQGARVPVLVTESPAGTPLARAGVPGSFGTSAILGDRTVNDGARFGGRFEAGTWLGPDWCDLGLQVGAFFLNDAQTSLSAGDGTGTRILARPYVNARTTAPTSDVVSFPRTRAGSVSATAQSSDVMGADALLRVPVFTGYDPGAFRFDALFGYRFLNLSEGLTVREEVTRLSGSGAGTATTTVDGFRTTNRFHGGTFGVAGAYRLGAFSVEASGRLGMGMVKRDTDIDGTTTTAVPGRAPSVTAGGLLAQVTNAGVHGQDDFTLVPEVELRLGWAVTPWLRLTAGYTLLLWQKVARPNDEVDLQVNTNLLPGATGSAGGVVRPTFPGATSDVWIQGLSLGVELMW
jgi:hypothetical protein